MPLQSYCSFKYCKDFMYTLFVLRQQNAFLVQICEQVCKEERDGIMEFNSCIQLLAPLGMIEVP